MLKRLLLVAALGMAALLSAGTPALATGPVTCPPGRGQLGRPGHPGPDGQVRAE